jgi:hypothetical protein
MCIRSEAHYVYEKILTGDVTKSLTARQNQVYRNMRATPDDKWVELGRQRPGLDRVPLRSGIGNASYTLLPATGGI